MCLFSTNSHILKQFLMIPLSTKRSFSNPFFVWTSFENLYAILYGLRLLAVDGRATTNVYEYKFLFF